MAPVVKLSSPTLLCALLLLFVSAVLTGCGFGAVSLETSGPLSLHGVVHGGQQPVSGARIRLYAAGKTGNGSTPRDMLSTTAQINGVSTPVDYVTTDGSGNFNITGDYSCTSSNDQVYIAATGGNPGLQGNVNNTALVMVAALGPCVNVPSISNIFIDEVTTVAAAWALAPFMNSATQVGASATNSTGIANAFADAQLLANSTNGQPATLSSTQVIETGKLYALANVISGCVNSDGTTGCSPLFSAATTASGSIPGDTLTAALNIVKNPGYHVNNVYLAMPTSPPYPSLLNGQPNDWTMSLTVSGGGIFSPAGMAVDTLGQPWVADYYGGVSAYTPQGVPLTGTPYGVGAPQAGDAAPDGESHGVLYETYGLVVDTNDNVWATVEENPYHSGTFGSVVVFAGSSSGTTLGSEVGQYYDPSIDFPEALAADNQGNVYIANYASGSGTVYNSSGGLVAGGIGDYVNSSGNTVSDAAFPVSIAPDGLGGTWIGNNDFTVTHVDAQGDLFRPTCCDDVDGINADASGNAWVSNYYGSSISEVSPGSVSNGVYTPGTVLINKYSGAGLSYPAGVALDAAQNVWVANFRGKTISEISHQGSPISPSTGYGLDASMSLPFGITPDASGNLWVTNFGANTLTMFFGLATPTSTPVTPPQTAP